MADAKEDDLMPQTAPEIVIETKTAGDTDAHGQPDEAPEPSTEAPAGSANEDGNG